MNALKSLLVWLIVGLAPLSANAQLLSAGDEPIDISSNAAEFHEELAIWEGDVRVIQGEALLTARRIEATITEDGDLEQFRAFGGIRFSNGEEAITGERAVFDEKHRTITISEKVIVTQGRQVMAAGEVIYWVDSGKVRFIPAAGKRVRGVFYPNSEQES